VRGEGATESAAPPCINFTGIGSGLFSLARLL